MAFITGLQLYNFRCYEQVRLGDIPSGLVVLVGRNGAGKTNILEAVSLLCPGKGIRGAKVGEMQKRGEVSPWAVSARVNSGGVNVTLGTGYVPEKEKRLIRINGVDARSQKALGDYMSCIWLVPRMDRLFSDASSGRRKFLDRMIFAYDAAHSGRVRRYENAMRQRSKLLRDGVGDDSWLSSLELQMAETGVAISAARLDFILRLQESCNQARGTKEEKFFPIAKVGIVGEIERLLQEMPALEVEAAFADELRKSRERDGIVGGAGVGVHKSDMEVVYSAKEMPASQCSTGEQKALLIGLIIANARLMKAERGESSVILLDEVAAHLDEGRRNALFDILLSLDAQVWMSGTDISLFSYIRDTARFFEVKDGTVFQA